MEQLFSITQNCDFTIRIRARRVGYNRYVGVSFDEMSGLIVNLINLPSQKTRLAYTVDEQGRLVIPVSGEGLACNLYGIEIIGFYNNGNWRHQIAPAFDIVKASAQDNYALCETDDCTLDFEITIGDTNVSTRLLTKSMNDHNSDQNAHPELVQALNNARQAIHDLQELIPQIENQIAEAGEVNDIQIDGHSILDQNKVANFNSDDFSHVNNIKVNGEPVIDENKEANIEVPTTVEQLSDSADFAKKTDLQDLTQQLEQSIEDAAVSEVEATVDNNTGTPEVEHSFENGKIRLGFRNLKGEKGDPLTWNDLTEPQKASLRGEPGAAAIWDENEPHTKITDLVHVPGMSNVLPMSQMGITSAIEKKDVLSLSATRKLTNITLKGVTIANDGSYGSNASYGCIQNIACDNIAAIRFSAAIKRIVFFDAQGGLIEYKQDSDTQIVVVPSNAASFSATIANSSDAYIKGVVKRNIVSTLDGNNNLAELTPSSSTVGKYVSKTGEDTDAAETRIVYQYACSPFDMLYLNFVSLASAASHVAFYDGEDNFIECCSNSSSSIINEYVTCPADTAYCKVSTFTDHPCKVYKVINNDAIPDAVGRMKASMESMEKSLAGYFERSFSADDLEEHGINNNTIGEAIQINTSSLFTNYHHALYPVAPGQRGKITTLAGKSIMLAYCFLDENNIVLATSSTNETHEDEEFTVPEGAAYIGVNFKENNSGIDFSLELYGVDKRIEDIEDTLDDIINGHAEESIPLYHGKDMFFIKDTPLDFYAQSVLFKNYPKYKGVYVNCAPDLSRRRTDDFSVPVITHINPTGKVYFEDGKEVGIYADDGKFYKDSWNAVTGITTHTTDLSAKQKSIKALFFGSSTTEYGLATYVKKYLNTLGVTVTCIGHKTDKLNTPSEGYAGWSNEKICGQEKTSSSAAVSSSQFIRLATAEDKENYPDYCFKYSTSKAEGTSYTDASDKTGDFYIFDFEWFLETNSLETPDVVFFLLGINGDVNKYGIYMPWIVDRIMQACPNCKIGINVAQSIRFESLADEKLESNRQKFDMLYQYVAEKNNANLKIVSCHCYQSPYFSHRFASEDGENAMTSKVTMSMDPDDSVGYLHMRNSGYQEIAKAIGAYIAYCLPDAQ